MIVSETHRTVRSSEPDTTVLPSLPMATLFTQAVWPSSVDLHTPDSRSLILQQTWI